MASREMSEGNDAQEQCVELLNQASLLQDERQKVTNLKKVQELIIHQDPALLDNFLDEVVAFQSDPSAEVRRTVLGFIEEACKKDNEMIPKVVANLGILLQDSFSMAVVKRTMQAISNIYRVTLQWLSSARTVTEVMDSAWSMLGQMKRRIIGYVDHDNDGVRTMAVKFMETVILLQTFSEPGSLKRPEFCLDGVPITLKIARPRKLEEEARSVFAQLIKFHGSPHISSVNLMACMGSLTLIARCRPSLLTQVISALESLHANLPPTLSKSQVNSVRKHMKMQLLNLLKHPASYDSHRNICTLLTDLGASQSEVMRAMPPPEELRKRQRRPEEPPGDADDDTPVTKRQKFVEDDDDEDEEEEEAGGAPPRPAPLDKKQHKANAIDITEAWAFERLTPALAANLVLVSMHNLPDTPPALFSNTFTPISAAGTSSQIQHVARLLAAQLTHAGIGPGVEATRNQGIQMTDHDWEMAEEEETPSGARQPIATVLAGTVSGRETKKKVALLPSGQMNKKHMAKPLRLPEITRPLPADELERMMTAALDRLLAAERTARAGGLAAARSKLLAMMSSHFTGHLLEKMLGHVLEDIGGRSDLVFSWLYEEYANVSGFSNLGQVVHSTASYEQVFCMLISALMVRPDFKDGETLLTRLFLEAPLVAESATHRQGIQLLSQLISRRPSKQLTYISALLQLASHNASEVRPLARARPASFTRTWVAAAGPVLLLPDFSCLEFGMRLKARKRCGRRALATVLELHGMNGALAAWWRSTQSTRLKYLRLRTPPALLLGDDQSAAPAGVTLEWTDELAKLCLHLYLALLPRRESLIHELAHVYVQTTADVKRTILRVLEAPIRGMGMESPELLTLVETCPKGAETLITRVIHILTDKTPPSAELVDRVRDLYQKRVSDVRFLIPVLNGLRKREVIAALPKLIRLNPVVVKEVFNRLLGIHSDTANFSSPLTPVELLVALHNIDPTKCDMKTIIKATSLCFAEKQVYTQEVLAVVLQQLMEQSPLPVLLMRTVIQSLALYNRLIGLVMNILQRLTSKQVWTQKKVWEGFIKCCQRTKPSSYQVLLQLPPEPLRDVFATAPELRSNLLDYVASFSEAQRGHIPTDVMRVLNGDRPRELADEPMSPPEVDSIDPVSVREAVPPPPLNPPRSAPPHPRERNRPRSRPKRPVPAAAWDSQFS
ncbi:symplekin-like [Pollicipes pollicipes]|uniref:symplekin-like n=1 Tax=Pollicipes pollicipes TaxID=41117 RepID=UPI001885A2AC|nr:symplekin-like [Pollicipes pollicipes]